MNWLKAMLLMIVLGAILYAVNLVLNKSAPVETPANNGAWSSTDGTMGPPVVSSGTAGTSAQPSYGQASYTQSATGSSASTAGNYPTPTPSTGYAPNGGDAASAPPASPSPYGSGPSQTIIGASSPTAGSATATPPVSSSDPARQAIPATPVGMVTGSQNATPQSAPAAGSGGGAAFASEMDNVKAMLRDGKLAEGLQRLTRMYDDPRLNADESKELNDLLGRLAGTVVYSRQHLLCPPREVMPGERLETIANEYQISVGLLAKINGISDPDHLTPGSKLKVIHGPFMALVSLNKREVTLVVQQCYAGRFPLTGVGKDAGALSGVYKVESKPTNSPIWIGFGDGNRCGFCGQIRIPIWPMTQAGSR